MSKFYFYHLRNGKKRILLINEKENNIQIKKEINGDNKQIKTYSLLNATIISDYKNDLDKENSIFIGTPAYNMIIKPNNEEDNKYIIKSLDKILDNLKSSEKIEKKEETDDEDSNKFFIGLSQNLSNLKRKFSGLINLFNEKNMMNDTGIKKEIEEFQDIMDKSLIKCYKYHDIVSDLEYNNLIFSDDTNMSTIEISKNLNNFSRLYSFKNSPNDIGIYKKNALYQSSIRRLNTSANTNNLNLKDSITPLTNIHSEDNSQNEFQCKDYIPSKKRKNLSKPLSFPPNLMKEMVINFTQNKTALPVYFNEPLSMLQKQCEKFYYLDLLKKVSNESKNKSLQIGYISAFIIGEIFLGLNRNLKPFNAIIGETYEFFDNKNNFRYYSEQVSHHPQITAFIGETPEFALYGDTKNSTSFKILKGAMELSFKNKIHLHIKSTNDHFNYNLPNLMIKGFLKSPIHNDYNGTTIIQNETFPENKAELKFIEESWTNSELGLIEGKIYCGDKVVYSIKGNWTNTIYLVDNENKENKIELF